MDLPEPPLTETQSTAASAWKSQADTIAPSRLASVYLRLPNGVEEAAEEAEEEAAEEDPAPVGGLRTGVCGVWVREDE